MQESVQFKFLSDAEFAKLDARGRAAYLVRAHREISERQRILREQMRRTVHVVDQDATIPVPGDGSLRAESAHSPKGSGSNAKN